MADEARSKLRMLLDAGGRTLIDLTDDGGLLSNDRARESERSAAIICPICAAAMASYTSG